MFFGGVKQTSSATYKIGDTLDLRILTNENVYVSYNNTSDIN